MIIATTIQKDQAELLLKHLGFCLSTATRVGLGRIITSWKEDAELASEKDAERLQMIGESITAMMTVDAEADDGNVAAGQSEP